MGKSANLKRGRHASPGVSMYDRDGLVAKLPLGTQESGAARGREENLHLLVLEDVDAAALLPMQQNDTVTFLYSERDVLVLGKHRRLGRVRAKDEAAVRSAAPAQGFLIRKSPRSDRATVAYRGER